MRATKPIQKHIRNATNACHAHTCAIRITRKPDVASRDLGFRHMLRVDGRPDQDLPTYLPTLLNSHVL